MTNKLIEIYEHMSAIPQVSEKYKSIGRDGLGNIFAFINTNYRQILSQKGSSLGGFANGYEVMTTVENIPRSQWTALNNAGQAKEKQHTVNMRRAELFMCDVDTYKSTSRGKVFKKVYTSENLSYTEKRLLTYLLILPGYFNETPNYIFERTKEALDSFEKQGLPVDYVISQMRIAIQKSNENDFKKNDIFDLDYLYLDSFVFDKHGLLALFNNSTEQEVVQFKDYVKARYLAGGSDIISHKYKNGGNYTPATLIENAWLLYLTHHLLITDIDSFDKFIASTINIYNSLFPIDVSKVKTFIYDTNLNQSVFRVAYSKLYNVPLHKDAIKDLTLDEINALGRIDSTDEQGDIQLEQVMASLKKLAKEKTGYRCECHNLENCRYFTAKENGKRYLEIHHLIPREFANDFDTSIEIIENYVPLCPNCHRKIHLAVDGERKHLVNNLLNTRKELLKRKKLDVNEKSMYCYYKIAE